SVLAPTAHRLAGAVGVIRLDRLRVLELRAHVVAVLARTSRERGAVRLRRLEEEERPRVLGRLRDRRLDDGRTELLEPCDVLLGRAVFRGRLPADRRRPRQETHGESAQAWLGNRRARERRPRERDVRNV